MQGSTQQRLEQLVDQLRLDPGLPEQMPGEEGAMVRAASHIKLATAALPCTAGARICPGPRGLMVDAEKLGGVSAGVSSPISAAAAWEIDDERSADNRPRCVLAHRAAGTSRLQCATCTAVHACLLRRSSSLR